MKYLLLFILLITVSCSRDNEALETTAALSSQIALQENSNIGNYQGVFTTLDSEFRATIAITIPNANTIYDVKDAYPTAIVRFENGKTLTLKAQKLQYAYTETEITFALHGFSFDFYVDAGGENETVTNAVFNNRNAAVLVAKSTQRAPVLPVTGTYVCTDCGTHPILGSGVEQTFNNLIITPVDATTASFMPQIVLGGTSYSGTGTQNNCVPNGTLTTCDIQGIIDTPEVDTLVNGIHIFNNEATALGNDCSRVNGTWSIDSPIFGLLEGTFSGSGNTGDCTTTLFDEDFEEYTGNGFSPTPSPGQLNSNVIIANGFDDGALAYSGTQNSGDYARGTSSGGSSTGGLYSFIVETGNSAFGIQPTGNDFTPGNVDIRILNNTGNTLTTFDISYLIYINNDQNRGNSLNFSYSTDNATFMSVSSLDFASDAASNTDGFTSVPRSTTINTTVANGNYLYIRFSGNDISGSGSRDEFGLDNILVKGL